MCSGNLTEYPEQPHSRTARSVRVSPILGSDNECHHLMLVRLRALYSYRARFSLVCTEITSSRAWYPFRRPFLVCYRTQAESVSREHFVDNIQTGLTSTYVPLGPQLRTLPITYRFGRQEDL
jgi:hypothetical protein